MRALPLISALALVAAVGTAGLVWRARDRPKTTPVPPTSTVSERRISSLEIAEVIFDGGLGAGWEDWGWGPHEIPDAGPARIQFAGYGGVILRHREMPSRFGGLVFRFKAPQGFGDFLGVSLANKQPDANLFPTVQVEPAQLAHLDDGWNEVLIPFSQLNAFQAPFDRVVIKARREVSSAWVLIDKVALTKAVVSEAGASPAPMKTVNLVIDCGKPTVAISPLIYGISHGTGAAGETAHRIGGNPMTRLNWELGFWNTGNDWFYENVKGSTGLWDWIDEAYRGGFKLALVVPMIGWVAKDATSVGFPVSRFGAQRAHDTERGEAGDGVAASGSPIRPGPPTATSVAAPPEVIGRWVQMLRAKDKERGGRGVAMYILDNEPNLWHTTHRDVHPDPLTYDELLDRTTRYGRAIRDADPEAVIAGPAEWGWSGYFFSAKDSASTWMLSPDRRAHGGIPLLPWYLGKLADYEKRTGVRLLDVVDVHFYPQAPGVYGKDARTDPETAALRLRSTRALWDPDYRDESWIKEHVNLIPRIKDWIRDYYPGRGLSIGEWNFGAEDHISGGLAVAEALGRFGQQGLTSAFFWGEAAPPTPAFQAFRAFRNFDGKGGRFLDSSVATKEAERVSLFASKDENGSRIVAVLLNFDPVFAADARIDMPACGKVTSRRVFAYGSSSQGIVEVPPQPTNDGALSQVLAPFSMTVIDLGLQPGN